jgi:predicted nucleic acid-binding protein
LAGSEYAALLREAAAFKVQGGTVYDALLLKSAIKAGVDVIYTLNQKHFLAIAPPEAAMKLTLP